MPDNTGYYGTLEAPMPVKEQAMGPVKDNGKGQFPPTPTGSMYMDRSQNGGTPEINGFSSIHIWALVNPIALRIETNNGA